MILFDLSQDPKEGRVSQDSREVSDSREAQEKPGLLGLVGKMGSPEIQVKEGHREPKERGVRQEILGRLGKLGFLANWVAQATQGSPARLGSQVNRAKGDHLDNKGNKVKEGNREPQVVTLF